MTTSTKLRDKILRNRGLVTTPHGLVKAAPVSDIPTATARLVESHFNSTPIKTILQHYSITDISRQTGVSRSTLHRWKNKLR